MTHLLPPAMKRMAPGSFIRMLVSVLGPLHDQGGRVRVLLASEDCGLCEYFDRAGVFGSTDMDGDGIIHIKIDDRNALARATCFEELAHALQFLTTGNIALSCDTTDRNAREREVATCVLTEAERLRLMEADREHYTKALSHYGANRD